MYFFCTISYFSVITAACYNVKRRMVYYLYKLRTIEERPIANASYTVGNYNTRNACAIRERRIANACYTVGDYYTRKTCSISKRPFANAGYTVGDFYARKACTIIERILINLITFPIIAFR